MQDVWIEFALAGHRPAHVRLHGLWLPGQPRPDAPLLLYLHGARWNVTGSAPPHPAHARTGFLGAGRGLPRLRQKQPGAAQRRHWPPRTRTPPGNGWREQLPEPPRYIFGHSLGGAIAIDLAAEVTTRRALLVEGTFTSIPDVVSTLKLGLAAGGPADHAAL
jgi:hypothetical protein